MLFRADDFAREYDWVNDRRLMEFAEQSADLVEPARAALREEFARRGLAWPEAKVVPITAQTVAARYGTMSNHKLLDEAQGYDALSEIEQRALREEFDERGLEPPMIEEEGGDEGLGDTSAGAEEAIKWVTVRAYRDLPEAIVARSVVEQADIPCVLRDEHMVGLDWNYSNMIGGVRLQVPEKYAEDAAAVLSQPIPETIATDSGEFEQPVCPRCGSLDVIADDLDRKIKLTSTMAMGLPLAIGLPALAFVKKDSWKCLNCDARWVNEKDPVAQAGDDVR